MKSSCICKNCHTSFKSYNPNPTFCSHSCKSTYQSEKIPLDKMIALYEEGMTQSEVAEVLGTTQKVIYSRMKKMGYQPRKAIKRNQLGENNSSWKGGLFHRKDGYIYRQRKGHPRATKCGSYVLEHILAVEDFIGRFLTENEVVHHINGNKQDNSPSNLYITTPSEHSTMHNNGTSHLVVSNLELHRSEQIG